MRSQRKGFTLIELMVVVAIIGVLAAIAIPNFLRFRARARQAEANANLKTLFTGMRTYPTKPSPGIRVPGFAPERGNRYSYLLNDPCTTFEARNGVDAAPNSTDDCIGVDSFRWRALPDLFAPTAPASVTWSAAGDASGVTATAGVYGSDSTWDFVAYAAGDVDDAPAETYPDTWFVSSADAEVASACPVTAAPAPVVAGEPYNVANDMNCN